MTISQTPLEGLLIIEPIVLADERGYFFESYRADKLADAGFTRPFVQDNESKSSRGVVRGLHLQAPPHAQDKLVRAAVGAIFDVAVDVRPNSPTYGKWFGIELNEQNKKALLIPRGFAHGFCSLSDVAVVQYRCTDYYNRSCEMGIKWNDADIGIEWPVEIEPIVSPKDQVLPLLRDFHSPF